MERPGPIAPDGTGAQPGFDESEAARILEDLRQEDPTPPPDLMERVGRRIRDRITLHDLIEVTTRAFARSTLLPTAERVASLLARARAGDSHRRKTRR